MAEKKTMAEILKTAEKKYNMLVGPLDTVSSDTKFVSTGNISVDYAIASAPNGGVPMGRTVEFYGPPSSGKAQRWTDVVHTPDRGFVPIKDLVVGDRLSSARGIPSRLLGVFPQGELLTYRVTFSDGTSTVATGNHLWAVEVMIPGMGYVTSVVTTDQISRKMQSSRWRERDVRLPEIEPVEMVEAEELRLPAYTMGALLGDGGLTQGSPVLTTKDMEILDRVREETLGYVDIVPVSQTPHSTSISYRLSNRPTGGSKNPITEALRSYGVWGKRSEEKYIPQEYKNSSVEHRIALLQGLMDTDGYGRGPLGGNGDGTVIFYSSSPRLALDVAEVARSLGINAFIRNKIPTYFYKEEHREGLPAFRVEMREPTGFSVFHLDRKKPNHATRKRSRNFVSIVPETVEECVCLKVSAPDELYLTNDYIPTHNTTMAVQTAVNLQRIIIAGGDPELGIGPLDQIIYLDYEQAFDASYAVALGLDPKHPSFQFSQPDTLEDGANFLLEAFQTGEVRLAIVDSVAAMTPSAKAEAEIGKSLPAVQAKLMKDFGGNLNPILRHNNGMVIFINHEMEVMEMGGARRPGMPAPTTTPGGKALKFFASVRLQFRQIRQIKGKVMDPLTQVEMEIPVATDTRVKVVKNKVAPPFRECLVRVRFGRGFDEFWTALQILLANKKVIYTAGRFYFHNLIEEAPADWMPRESKGTKRPYLHGMDRVFDSADEHTEWRAAMIRIASVVAAENYSALDDVAQMGSPVPDDDEDLPENIDDILDDVTKI